MNESRTFHLLDNNNITEAFEKQLKGCVNVIHCLVANDSFTELSGSQPFDARGTLYIRKKFAAKLHLIFFEKDLELELISQIPNKISLFSSKG